jgi:heme/copper-type cytochrome/quinol oxidase subunit 3
MAFVGSGIFAKKVAGTQIQNPNPTMGYLLLVLFFACLAAIFYHEITSDKAPSLIDKYRPDRHWEIWAILGSEIFFFGALIGTGLVLRYNSNNWPKASDIQNIPLISLNTFVLITSSFTMVKAVAAIKQGDVDRLKRFLLMTIGLGIVFLSIQAFEYSHLLAEGDVGLSDSSTYRLYSSAFLTGFHGLHVFLGVLFLILVYFRAAHGGYSKDNNEYVEFIGLYWHFVDAVWVVLFTVIYLI